jgi:hypothetical protein
MAWVRRKRLEFIEFRLLWEGRVRRAALTSAFHISEQQASVDIAAYDAAAPGNIVYDVRQKVYLRSNSFEPRFIASLIDRFLLQLMAVRSAQMPASETYFGELLPSEVAALPHEPTRWDVIMWIARAIRKQQIVEMDYTSLNPRSKKRKTVAPHALGYGSNRWHVRAWSKEHNEFRDYTFDRISNVQIVGESSIQPEWDKSWYTEFPLILAPNPVLPPEVQRVIAKERRMKGGQLKLRLPLSLCFYLIHDLNLDLARKVKWGDGTGRSVSPHRLQLVLLNWDDYQKASKEAERASKQLLEQLS